MARSLGSIEGFALYAHARDTSIIENDCVRAICTGVRRRGIGTAMTVAALDLVRRQGGRHAVLTASPDGFGIYERLGLETVATVRRPRGRDGS